MLDITENVIRDTVVLAISEKFPVVEVWDEDDGDTRRICFDVTYATPEQALRAETAGIFPPMPRANSYVSVWVENGLLNIEHSRLRHSRATLSIDYTDPSTFEQVMEFVQEEYDARSNHEIYRAKKFKNGCYTWESG